MRDLTLILQELPFSRVLKLLSRRRRARRDAKHLASLDDYLLRDIGLTRGEVEGDSSPLIPGHRP